MAASAPKNAGLSYWFFKRGGWWKTYSVFSLIALSAYGAAQYKKVQRENARIEAEILINANTRSSTLTESLDSAVGK